MSRGARAATLLLDVAVVVIVVGAALAAIPAYLVERLATPFQASFWEVLPQTALADLRVWTFWGVASAVIAAALLRAAPALGLLDAALGGAFGVWVIAYLGGHLLGPIGLLRSWMIWLVLALGAVAVARRPPTIARPPLSPGARLVLLALAIATPGLLVLQLGSPVPPHFDVFAPPAAAQRIVTFHHYLPFDNDPYGYYDAASQCPGTELLYAFLALGGGLPVAILAETAALVPLAVLLILATYRLGKTLGGDRVGGFASLLLFATVLFRTLPTGHGRYTAFVPVAAGLAFLLDPRRHPARLALGALFLGTAVAAHAIIGAFGMVAAAGAMLVWILSGDVAGGLAGIGLLAGASLVALPTVAVALRVVVPYPVLPLVQALGVVVTIVAARRMPARPPREARWLVALVTLAVAALMATHPTAIPTVHDHISGYRYPLLWPAGILGVAVVVFTKMRVLRAPIVFALLAAIGAELLSVTVQQRLSDPRVTIAFRDLVFKADFWYPFALVFPAACLAAALARLLGQRVVLYALLVALMYPWQYGNTRPGGRDPNYFQHSVAEAWAEEVSISKVGYWGSMGDRRWAQSPAEFELIDVLRGEIAAGRITLDTHVVHLTPYIYLYMDTVLFSVYTGINDDLYVAKYVFDQSNAGGRFYPAAKIHDALAAHPSYVVIHDRTANAVKLEDQFADALALDGYDEIFNGGGVRLLRARAVAGAPGAPG